MSRELEQEYDEGYESDDFERGYERDDRRRYNSSRKTYNKDWCVSSECVDFIAFKEFLGKNLAVEQIEKLMNDLDPRNSKKLDMDLGEVCGKHRYDAFRLLFEQLKARTIELGRARDDLANANKLNAQQWENVPDAYKPISRKVGNVWGTAKTAATPAKPVIPAKTTAPIPALDAKFYIQGTCGVVQRDQFGAVTVCIHSKHVDDIDGVGEFCSHHVLAGLPKMTVKKTA